MRKLIALLNRSPKTSVEANRAMMVREKAERRLANLRSEHPYSAPYGR